MFSFVNAFAAVGNLVLSTGIPGGSAKGKIRDPAKDVSQGGREKSAENLFYERVSYRWLTLIFPCCQKRRDVNPQNPRNFSGLILIFCSLLLKLARLLEKGGFFFRKVNFLMHETGSKRFPGSGHCLRWNDHPLRFGASFATFTFQFLTFIRCLSNLSLERMKKCNSFLKIVATNTFPPNNSK